MSEPECPMAAVCQEYEAQAKTLRFDLSVVTADRDEAREMLRRLGVVSVALEAARRMRPRRMLRVSFAYLCADGTSEPRRVTDAVLRVEPEGSPYAGQWTLYGFCLDREQPRSFLIERIESPTPLA